jgi:hypothetical protein
MRLSGLEDFLECSSGTNEGAESSTSKGEKERREKHTKRGRRKCGINKIIEEDGVEEGE